MRKYQYSIRKIDSDNIYTRHQYFSTDKVFLQLVANWNRDGWECFITSADAIFNASSQRAKNLEYVDSPALSNVMAAYSSVHDVAWVREVV